MRDLEPYFATLATAGRVVIPVVDGESSDEVRSAARGLARKRGVHVRTILTDDGVLIVDLDREPTAADLRAAVGGVSLFGPMPLRDVQDAARRSVIHPID